MAPRAHPAAPRSPGGPAARRPDAAGSPADPPGCALPPPTVGAGLPSVVDWGRTARRLRVVLLALAGLVVLSWLVVGAVRGGLELRLLGELAGAGVLLAVAAEIAVVGGSALRGMLVAGERGDRLAGGDVSLVPPQLRRRGRCR